jgi:hypothetical protein
MVWVEVLKWSTALSCSTMVSVDAQHRTAVEGIGIDIGTEQSFWEVWNWLMNTLYGVLLEHGKRAFVALIVVAGGGREIWRAFGMWLGGRAGVSSGSIR